MNNPAHFQTHVDWLIRCLFDESLSINVRHFSNIALEGTGGDGCRYAYVLLENVYAYLLRTYLLFA